MMVGVFNYIKTTLPCHKCGRKLKSFQSKHMTARAVLRDVPVALTLGTYDLKDIWNGEIHDWCSKCQEMTEYQIVKGELQNPQERTYMKEILNATREISEGSSSSDEGNTEDL